MASTIRGPAPTEPIHLVGNSITAFIYWLVAHGLIDQINARGGAPQVATQTLVSGGGRAVVSGGGGVITYPTYQRPGAVTYAGYPGENITQFEPAAQVAARVTNFLPASGRCWVFMETGANDELNVASSVVYAAAYTSWINQILAYNPQTQICIWPCLCLQEEWLPGPVWNVVSNRLLSTLQGVVAGYPNVVCPDVNTAALLFLAANKPSGAGGVRFLTYDGIHPVDRGRVFLADNIIPVFTW